MKHLVKISLIIVAVFLLVGSYIQSARAGGPSKVEIRSVAGKYSFYINGERFDLKGAGGGGSLAALHQAGGNALRTWNSSNAQQLLDSAAKYNIMIAMGISMGQELHGFNYNDTAAVGAQYRRNTRIIDQYKNHPNLLCWVAGNELNLSPNRRVPVNPRVYDALKEVVDYIHRTDKHHPVTTAFAGVSRDHIAVALERCPGLDFISLQVYGGLARIPDMAKAAGVTKPYAVTEYGPIGHWEMPRTAWGREIEETSTAKATGLYDRIQKGLVNDPSGLGLGGFAFLWGQKQERTPTWYGIFLKSGEATAVVDELTRYWTGHYPENRAPRVDSLKLEDKNAVDNLYVAPGKECTARVYASDPELDRLAIQWIIMKEVVQRSEGGARETEPGEVTLKVISNQEGTLRFVAPAEPGEYRLFAYLFDGKGKAGTANFPFCVK